MGAVTGKAWTDYSEPRIMAADLEAIEAGIAGLAASTIVGAGRPDIPATMTADVQTLVSAATSGAVFRSTDGPQGAWEWRKRGSTWACIEGDTGWRDVPLLAGWALADTAPSCAIRRVGESVHFRIRIKATEVGAARSLSKPLINLPAGFNASAFGAWPGGVTALSGATSWLGVVSTLASAYRLDVEIPGVTATWEVGDVVTIHATLITVTPWPTTLPGSPA